MFDIKINSHRGEYSVIFTSFHRIPKEELEDSFFIIDSKVYDLYPDIMDKLEYSRIFVMDAKEDNKTLVYCEKVLKFLLSNGIKKNHNIVAIGGGVVQDVASFTASILYRGVEWRFIPTTLLAQADSCIGSKTSINFNKTKNTLGTFYPPSKIWCDTDFLHTLEEEDIQSGVGEILHYYLIDGTSMVDSLCEDSESINMDKLFPHIHKSLSIKKDMIERDEFDKGERRIFNYGHTFGHAIEVLSNHKVNHGQAVTLGMHMANYIAQMMDLIDDDYWEMQESISFNLPDYSIDHISEYIDILMRDKKNEDGSLVCILPHGKADMRVVKLDNLAFLRGCIESYWVQHNHV
jgi:3-dehydroquinate synthase